jgi:hypothetical protein
MNQSIAGGCACDAIRYSSSGAVEFAFHCHCRKCQRATGGGHSSAFALDETVVEFTGAIKFFEQTADTGYKTYAGFCPTCGSPILSKTTRFPDRIYVHAATLDDPTKFEPKFIVFKEAAQPWDPVDARLEPPDL